MKAVAFARYGPAEVLEIVEREPPRPGTEDCLVRVLATSINPLDHRVRAGILRRILWLKLPFVPGWDCCGEVVETGAAVTGFRPGDTVYAFVPYRSAVATRSSSRCPRPRAPSSRRRSTPRRPPRSRSPA